MLLFINKYVSYMLEIKEISQFGTLSLIGYKWIHGEVVSPHKMDITGMYSV